MYSINSTSSPTKRLRVFAGPNGSGKSTVIKLVRDYKLKGIPVDFGIYVNADDIAAMLEKGSLSIKRYKIKANNKDFQDIVLKSGLVPGKISKEDFLKSYKLSKDRIRLMTSKHKDELAQIIAYYLREKLLLDGKKFSFETVFSHSSKLDLMKRAEAAGYKVYLYFVATEDPQINKYRVELRQKQGGHNVRPDLIESRYYRSLELLYDAAQLTYQTYFFDNTGLQPLLSAHFKKSGNKKRWDKIEAGNLPDWFVRYYLNKVNR